MSGSPRGGIIALIALAAVVLTVGVVVATRLTEATPMPPTTYTASDCPGVAREYGALVDTRVRDILVWPSLSSTMETRGVRMNHAWTNALTIASAYLRARSIACDGTAFMATATSQAWTRSASRRRGGRCYVGRVATWEEWIAEVTSTTVDIIDDR